MSSEGNYSCKITDWSCNLLLISFSQIVFPEHLADQTIPAPTQPPPKKKRCFGETNSKTTTYCIWGTRDVTENLTNSHLIQRFLNYNLLCGTPIEPSQNNISKKTVWKISCIVPQSSYLRRCCCQKSSRNTDNCWQLSPTK